MLVEGGATVHGSFFQAGLVDEFYLFIAPLLIGGAGTPLLRTELKEAADNRGLPLHIADTTLLGEDCLVHGFRDAASLP